MGRTQNKLRIGLIVDSTKTSKHVYDLAEWGQRQSDLVITTLIIQQVPKRGSLYLLKKQGLVYVATAAGFMLINLMESFLLKIRHKRYISHLRGYDLANYVKNTITISPAISSAGFVYRYNGDDVHKIKDLGLDLLVRCGSGILRGKVLNSVPFGIISFHHADNAINRGGPPGFWEVYLMQDSTGFTIQQLTEELDGGNVLFKGRIQTKYFCLLNRVALYERSNLFLKKVLLDIAKRRRLPPKLEAYPYYNPLYKTPGLRAQLNYVSNRAVALIGQLCDKLNKKVYCWGVSFAYSNWRNLVMWRAIKIKNPPNRYLADPFVITVGEGDYCFVEDYDFRAARACISVYKLSEEKSERIGEAIIEPFHMSYPYIFEYRSRLYMCPETFNNRDIRLYECEEFPLKWKLTSILMSNVSAADTTIFEKDGMWWLFSNLDLVNDGDHCTDLFLFFSDNPISGNWEPHPMNPIFTDSLKARMGGILFENGSVFRVSQKQGFDMYGKSVAINRIDRLSKTDYAETMVYRIEPNFYSKLDGTHHVHSNGKITVFDYVEKKRADY
jgi:hypothetical protein